MSVEGIRDAIQTGLDTIAGLRAYDNVPDSPSELPCAFPIPREGQYDFTASAENYILRLEIVLLLGRQGEIEEIQEDLDDYIAPTGTKSIKAAVEAADFGTNADSVRVSGFKDYGGIEFGGTMFIGAKFDVEAII